MSTGPPPPVDQEHNKDFGLEVIFNSPDPAPLNVDIEMGEMGEMTEMIEMTANPMLKKALKKVLGTEDNNMKLFGKAVKKEAGGSAGKALGGGVGAKQGVNAEALSKVVGGVGGPVNLERLNIGINFAQNFGMVVALKWLPVDLKKWFEWVGALGLDFDMFGGMGESVSIALGLLVPAWLIYEYMHDMHLRNSF